MNVICYICSRKLIHRMIRERIYIKFYNSALDVRSGTEGGEK